MFQNGHLILIIAEHVSGVCIEAVASKSPVPKLEMATSEFQILRNQLFGFIKEQTSTGNLQS